MKICIKWLNMFVLNNLEILVFTNDHIYRMVKESGSNIQHCIWPIYTFVSTNDYICRILTAAAWYSGLQLLPSYIWSLVFTSHWSWDSLWDILICFVETVLNCSPECGVKMRSDRRMLRLEETVKTAWVEPRLILTPALRSSWSSWCWISWSLDNLEASLTQESLHSPCSMMYQWRRRGRSSRSCQRGSRWSCWSRWGSPCQSCPSVW